MKLSTWLTDEAALGHLVGAVPPPPPPRPLPRPKAPARPIPWRTIVKLHLPLGVALVAYELLHLAADLQPVVVATWAALVEAANVAVPTVLATLVFALVVFVLRRRR